MKNEIKEHLREAAVHQSDAPALQASADQTGLPAGRPLCSPQRSDMYQLLLGDEEMLLPGYTVGPPAATGAVL